VNDTRENYSVYPLLEYLSKGVLVSINTDNIGISDANLTDNFMLLTEMLPEITRLDVLKLIRNGLETAFISPEFRFNLLSIFEKQVYINCKNISLNHE
jgi:adenosine deaminase